MRIRFIGKTLGKAPGRGAASPVVRAMPACKPTGANAQREERTDGPSPPASTLDPKLTVADSCLLASLTAGGTFAAFSACDRPVYLAAATPFLEGSLFCCWQLIEQSRIWRASPPMSEWCRLRNVIVVCTGARSERLAGS